MGSNPGERRGLSPPREDRRDEPCGSPAVESPSNRPSGLATDGPGLLRFFQQLTPGPEDQRQIAAWIDQLDTLKGNDVRLVYVDWKHATDAQRNGILIGAVRRTAHEVRLVGLSEDRR